MDANSAVRGKRKASESASQSIKKTRLSAAPANCDDAYESANDSGSQDSDDDDDDDDDGIPKEEYRTESGTNTPSTPSTPSTPFSPRRNRFPSELKTLKCPYEGCQKSFNRPVRLEAHLRAHRNERPFACEYEGCDKRYIQEKHLKQHIKGSHLHEKLYQCTWEGCGKTFLTGQRLRRHVAIHEGQDRFRCTGHASCTETFRKHQTLQRHIRSAHLGLPEYPCTHIDPETSVACDAAFDAASSLRNHVDREHGRPRFACDECAGENDEHGNPRKLIFTTKAQLTQHIKEEHAQCMFCNLKCSSQQALRLHLEALHSGTSVEERKRVPCTYPGCDKTFTKNSNRNAHIRSAHEGEKFVCGEVNLQDTNAGAWDGQGACGNHFSTKANLADHVRTQHMALPSIINAGRIKGTGKKGTGKKKTTNKETSIIDELTGKTYRDQQGRDIPCAIMGCPYKFMRSYDHIVHLQAQHSMTEDQATSFCEPTPGGEDLMEIGQTAAAGNTDVMEQSLNQFGNEFIPESAANPFVDLYTPGEDIEWQLQRQAEEGGAFWFGADDTPAIDNTWLQDEREMQALIGPDERADNSFWDLIDPDLR